MKTVCKKLLSLALVALLLVSAVPMAQAAGTEYTVKVGCMDEDRTVETCTTKVSFTDGEIAAMKEMGADAELAADLLDMADSAYKAKATDDNIHSIMFTNGVIQVWLKDCGGSSVPGGDGDGSGSGSTKAVLTIDPNNGAGTYKVEATIGASYMSVLAAKTPAYPGAKFINWKSAAKGVITDSTMIEGDDTITAIWETVTYHLTLDENRAGEESVNYGVTINYNEKIADRIAAYMPGGSKAPKREGYVFVGWKLNGKIITENTRYELQGDATAYAEWKLESDTENKPVTDSSTTKGKVYLEIYTNDNTKDIVKRVDITKYADDNKITRAEVEKEVKKVCTAKKGYSLKLIGLFDEESWWWYTHDDETDGKSSIIVNRDGDDYIYVMVNNVKTTQADSSNPKTGDNIFVAVTGMGLSAAALAVLYVFGKKRFAL